MPHLLVVLTVLVLGAERAWTQTASPAESSSELERLMDRIEKLEARVARLEQEPCSSVTAPITSTASTPLQGGPPARNGRPLQSGERVPSLSAEPAPAGSDTIDLAQAPEFPSLEIRGFTDVGFHATDLRTEETSFLLGQFDMFLTSRLSEKLSVFGELVLHAHPAIAAEHREEHEGAELDGEHPVDLASHEEPGDGSELEHEDPNTIDVDLERILLQYSFNDYFNLAFGRYHTAIGYYNNAFHHGSWLETATGRPFIFAFEHDGGILPIHGVGLEAKGRIPSGPLGLQYVAEIANGRAPDRTAEPVQNFLDEDDHKAVNFALLARPQRFPGMQAGFSIYYDRLEPHDAPRIGETILAANAIYARPEFELLNEALLIRHAPRGTEEEFHTPAFYTQIARQFGKIRPYLRYQYLNAPDDEPVFSGVGRRNGPSLGVRYDVGTFAALKAQYDYTDRRRLPSISEFTMQFAYTF